MHRGGRRGKRPENCGILDQATSKTRTSARHAGTYPRQLNTNQDKSRTPDENLAPASTKSLTHALFHINAASMSKTTYQSYTAETPIRSYRADFMRRGAMCAALVSRYPSLAAIASEAKTIASSIDGRLAALQSAEDDELIANALEDAEKIDVVDVYTEMRRTMFAKNIDISTILPDAPSTLARLGVDAFATRTEAAIAAIKALPATDPIRIDFLANLEKELAEFRSADNAEDATRDALKTIRLALTLYKSELAQTREVQMGTLLTILKDRQKVALFTVPWRKSSRPQEEEPSAEPLPTP